MLCPWDIDAPTLYAYFFNSKSCLLPPRADNDLMVPEWKAKYVDVILVQTSIFQKKIKHDKTPNKNTSNIKD